MKVFVLNGPKIAYSLFSIVCVSLIIYFMFISTRDKVVATANFSEPSYIAVIIDDFGNGRSGTEEFLYSEIPYTAAVMPNMPYTASETKELIKNGKDVILHMPMEAHDGNISWLGEEAILSDMSWNEVRSLLEESVAGVEGLVGINNHMGSKIMEDEEIVRNILEYCKEHDLIFIDSKTTNKSEAKKLSEEIGVTFLERDIFLDGTEDISIIEANLLRAAEIAKETGFAVAIGHVGQEGGKPTIQAMENLKEKFDQENIQFVTVTDYIRLMNK